MNEIWKTKPKNDTGKRIIHIRIISNDACFFLLQMKNVCWHDTKYLAIVKQHDRSTWIEEILLLECEWLWIPSKLNNLMQNEWETKHVTNKRVAMISICLDLLCVLLVFMKGATLFFLCQTHNSYIFIFFCLNFNFSWNFDKLAKQQGYRLIQTKWRCLIDGVGEKKQVWEEQRMEKKIGWSNDKWAIRDWPVWIRLWIFSVDLCENRFEQISHPKGRSPVWVRWWMSRYGFLQNAAGHKSQRNGRFPTVFCFQFESTPKRNQQHTVFANT